MGNEKRPQQVGAQDDEDDIGESKEEDENCSNSQDPDLYPPSPLSSSPPKDFDVNIEGQYMPIFDENYDSNEDLGRRTSSLVSSISMQSDHDYATSPVILTTNTSRIIRCPVCEKPMRTFYCAKCIQRGRFVTLDHQALEDVSSTRIRYISEHQKSATDTDLPIVDEEERTKEMQQIRLRTLKRKTESLTRLYNEQKLRLEATKNILRETREQVEIEKKSYKSKESKIELIRRFVNSRRASVKKREDNKLKLLDELKQWASRWVYQLIRDVFTLEEVNLFEQQNSEFVNMETSPLLTFSDGSHHQIEQQTAHMIVEPWLPTNGDYSAYSLWVNEHQDRISAPVNDDLSERNPAYRIGAGLTYTTQLVKNLASYLDVILPVRMDHDMFSHEMLSDTQFSYNVAKVNANVVHLCVSQGIDISLLSSQRTLRNLMLLFNVNICDLGRKPTLELDNEEAARRIEEQLNVDLSLVREDLYDFSKLADDDDVSDSEWEISDSINPSDMQLAGEQSIQQNSYISRLPLRLIASFWSGSGS